MENFIFKLKNENAKEGITELMRNTGGKIRK